MVLAIIDAILAAIQVIVAGLGASLVRIYYILLLHSAEVSVIVIAMSQYLVASLGGKREPPRVTPSREMTPD